MEKTIIFNNKNYTGYTDANEIPSLHNPENLTWYQRTLSITNELKKMQSNKINNSQLINQIYLIDDTQSNAFYENKQKDIVWFTGEIDKTITSIKKLLDLTMVQINVNEVFDTCITFACLHECGYAFRLHKQITIAKEFGKYTLTDFDIVIPDTICNEEKSRYVRLSYEGLMNQTKEMEADIWAVQSTLEDSNIGPDILTAAICIFCFTSLVEKKCLPHDNPFLHFEHPHARVRFEYIKEAVKESVGFDITNCNWVDDFSDGIKQLSNGKLLLKESMTEEMEQQLRRIRKRWDMLDEELSELRIN